MPINHEIELAISTPRLRTYRALASDDEHAWAIYRWNLDLTASLVHLVSDVEVTLRNIIHNQLAAHFGRDDWWAHRKLILDDTTSDMLAQTVRRYQKKLQKGTVGHGKIIADLTLGTWVMLLSRGGHSALGKAVDYETNLWRPALRFGFATGSTTQRGRIRRPTREDVHSRASNLQRLRNRAAHHEPLFNGIVQAGNQQPVRLLDVRQQTIELLRWMSPALAAHHDTDPAVSDLLANMPQHGY